MIHVTSELKQNHIVSVNQFMIVNYKVSISVSLPNNPVNAVFVSGTKRCLRLTLMLMCPKHCNVKETTRYFVLHVVFTNVFRDQRHQPIKHILTVIITMSLIFKKKISFILVSCHLSVLICNRLKLIILQKHLNI